MDETDPRRMTRRSLLGAGVAGAGALGLGALLGDPIVAAALAAPRRCGALSDIEHVVILVQENRSFDHYFGSYRGVAGFQDPHAAPGIFSQQGYPVAGYDGVLQPFHIDTANGGECTSDINHSWGPQHNYWNGGRLDQFVSGHVAVDGAARGALTMGYYSRADLEFYYALADAFTICDHYHSSVIGPTDPNRLYAMSASLGPDGGSGGPILSTSTTRVERFGSLSWTTMPEQLEARGVSWKVYSTPDGNFADNVLPYFKQYQSNPKLLAKALVPSFPGTFELDCLLGTLPKVSWVLAPLLLSEHPPTPVEWGQYASAKVLKALTGNPSLWAKTALFITFDENGGFFDHVPPPVAPVGTPGEYLTPNSLPSEAAGVRGPIGLGFRVPMLIASPFARGGLVCSDTFDHTSTLRFLEARFGAEVPNLSAWRRSVTGDLTSAFNFAAPDRSVPSLPRPSLVDPRVLGASCLVGAPTGLIGDVNATLGQLVSTLLPINYPIPPNGGIPPQEPGSAPAPSGPVACTAKRSLTRAAASAGTGRARRPARRSPSR
jgi:phospholipase C